MSLARILALLVVLLSIGSATPARAEAPPKPPAKPYTGQVLLADGLSLGVHAAGFAMYEGGDHDGGARTGAIGLLGWMLAAPIVHYAHERPVVGTLDLGARILVPVAIFGALRKDDALGPVLYGSVAAVSAVDALVLARPTDDVQHTPYREGQDVPAGGVVETRPRWPLVVAGAGSAGLAYAWWYVAIEDSCKHARGDDAALCTRMKIPLVGPWFAVANVVGSGFATFDCPKDAPVACGIYPVAGAIGLTLAVADGLFQVGGIAAAVAGFVYPEKTVVRPRQSAVTVKPTFGLGAVGLSGTF